MAETTPATTRLACPECGYRDNYTFFGWWHCRGCGHSWRDRAPWQERLRHWIGGWKW